ncbi:MAG: hypothetical protein Q4G34_06010, partial [Micrococcus sp.]|nr:hypothetical protein [Micrococcus sp.]
QGAEVMFVRQVAPTLEDLARAEGAGRDPVDRQAWERFSPRFASLLVGSIAQRSVAHALVAGPATPLPIHVISGPIGERVLAAHRSAAYGVEVAAAHLREGRRAVAVEVLADLRRVEEQLVADLPEAPPRPLGYALPETVTVTDADSASALLQAVLERLTDVVVAAAGPTAEALRAGGAAGAGAVGTLIDLATAAELARVRCGGPLAPGVPARTMARAEGPAPVSPGLASPPAG